MSELKTRFIDDTYAEYYNTGKHDLAQVYIKAEADKVIAELKAREDVLVTDNRNLLDKVKMLEECLRENAEHFKRNEAQIIEASDNEIKKLKARIAELEEEHRWRKFQDEKPEGEGDYLVMARYPDDDELHIEICFYDLGCEDFGHYERRYAGSGNSFGGFDGEEWVTHNVSFWMPLPSAPKEEK